MVAKLIKMYFCNIIIFIEIKLKDQSKRACYAFCSYLIYDDFFSSVKI